VESVHDWGYELEWKKSTISGVSCVARARAIARKKIMRARELAHEKKKKSSTISGVSCVARARASARKKNCARA